MLFTLPALHQLVPLLLCFTSILTLSRLFLTVPYIFFIFFKQPYCSKLFSHCPNYFFTIPTVFSLSRLFYFSHNYVLSVPAILSWVFYHCSKCCQLSHNYVFPNRFLTVPAVDTVFPPVLTDPVNSYLCWCRVVKCEQLFRLSVYFVNVCNLSAEYPEQFSQHACSPQCVG